MTVPATSWPRISGSVYGRICLNSPGRIFSSSWFSPGRPHLDEEIPLADGRLGNVCFLQRTLVSGDDERLHDLFLQWGGMTRWRSGFGRGSGGVGQAVAARSCG